VAASKDSHQENQNRLLAALPKKEYKRVLQHLRPVSLDLGQVIYEPDEPIRYVYFPNHGVVSILNTLNGRMSIEVGTVGNEGVVGVTVFLGVDKSPHQAVVQVPGDGVRMKSDDFKKAADANGTFQALLRYYTYVLLTQASLSVACNRFHNVEKRFARWLLAIHDRVREDEFLLTQEYISRMLGAHRPHVTTAAGALQKARLIDYSRGKITILDRDGLERVACGCYQNGKEKFDGLFGA
jgi:CRP-like cAMP-binding protein